MKSDKDITKIKRVPFFFETQCTFQMGMGMGMTFLKWEGFGMKNLFPHISTHN